jgi:PleD family two-component response regulator
MTFLCLYEIANFIVLHPNHTIDCHYYIIEEVKRQREQYFQHTQQTVTVIFTVSVMRILHLFNHSTKNGAA